MSQKYNKTNYIILQNWGMWQLGNDINNESYHYLQSQFLIVCAYLVLAWYRNLCYNVSLDIDLRLKVLGSKIYYRSYYKLQLIISGATL